MQTAQFLNLLNTNNFNVYNVDLAVNLGVNVAIYYQSLLKFDTYGGIPNMAKPDGYFIASIGKVTEWTGLTEDQQRVARAKLIALKIIDYRVLGMPATGHFKICDNLETLLQCTIRLIPENPKLDPRKPQTRDLQIGDLQIGDLQIGDLQIGDLQKNKKLREKEEQMQSFSTLPNFEGCKQPKQAKNKIFSNVVDYLNLKTGKKFSPNSVNVKKHIEARINNGHTLADFKHVIDVKCSQWLGDVKMVVYLRPETLFSTKFDTYLTERAICKSNGVESIDGGALSRAKNSRSNTLDDECF